MLAKNQNIAFLVALAFAVAASANLPTILYSLFWKGFNTRGALWSIYGGLTSAIVLIIFSPVVSGKPPLVEGGPSQSMITNTAIDFHLFPLDNPGLISIPLGVLPRLARLGHEQGAQRPASTPRWRSAASPVTGWRRRSTTDRHLRHRLTTDAAAAERVIPSAAAARASRPGGRLGRMPDAARASVRATRRHPRAARP